MEKFAVDLEKVLDEFEFNEEREEQDTPPAIKSHPLPHLGLCQVPSRPPAASYRRPTFEPINLSEADFSASPPNVTPIHYDDILIKPNLNTDSSNILQNGLKNRNYIAPSSSRNILGSNNIVNIKDVIAESGQELRPDEGTWSTRDSLPTTDEKPDLLEYKPSDYLKDVILPPQLPDVTTSVWSLTNGLSSNFDEPLKNAPLCDLIHSSNGNLYDHIKHNELLENDSGNQKSSQLRSEVLNYSSERTENNQNDIIHKSDPSILNSDISSDAVNLNSTQDVECTVTNTFCRISSTSEIDQDKNDNLSQALPPQDLYRTLDKETVNNNKIEISGSLNMLHQTAAFQHTNLLSLDNEEEFVRNSDKPEMAESVENINVSERHDSLSKMNLNHDWKDGAQESEYNQPVDTSQTEGLKTNFTEAVETIPNSTELINNAKDCQKTVAKSKLCHADVDIKPIGFTSSSDMTDSELQQYLDELENTHSDELCLNAEQSQFGKDSTLSEENVSVETTNNTSESLPEFNNKRNTVLEYNNDLGIKVKNTNRKEQNLDLSIKLSDHISGVECVSQPTYVDMNPQLSSITVGSDNKVEGSVEIEEGLESSYQNATKENSDCEYDTTEKQLLDKSTTYSVSSPDSGSTAQIVIESVSIEKTLDDSENNNNKMTNEFNSVTKLEPEEPSSVIEEKSENAGVDSNLAQCSLVLNEFINRSAETNDQSLNFSRSEDNSEFSISEDISGDSESSSYKIKVIRNTEESETEDVHKYMEKENTIDCDSLMSQESLEEDSFNKPSDVLRTNRIQYLDSSSPSNSEYESVLNVSTKMIPVKTAVECESQESVDEAGIPAEEDKPSRPNSLELPTRITVDTEETSTLPLSPTTSGEVDLSPEERRLGKVAPVWVPDNDAPVCMQCQIRFTVIKRRHHCRACGQVLCSKCCCLKARLEFCGYSEVRVCQPCFSVLETVNGTDPRSPLGRQPNPNNPMEYCSTIPPLQQVAGSLHQPPPSVMVPVGVLKREGRSKSDVAKQVMFSDGIRPGGDLTELDGSGEPRIPFRRPGRQTKRVGTPPGGPLTSSSRRALDPATQSFIPKDGEMSLPPVVTYSQGELRYTDREQPIALNEGPFKFAVNRNLNVHIKRVLLDCCVNRECWCISSDGLSCVGQDEVVFLLECLPQETLPPKDIFLLINSLYQNAAKGTTVSEMSFTPASSNKLLGSRDHGGFLYIRPSYQCTAKLILPPPPYLCALLIHRWETPWARLFPIRLVLRLGAEFRYYPCPLVSVRHRAPLYTDIGHTIINLLADFRKYSYTLPTVRGLVIHMEDRQTSILLPRNRYDQVIRALNNSNDSVLAFGANFSLAADSHLVCMQSVEDESTSYHTQAINIHNKPRRVTGASFVVFNGALKTPGLAGKSNIVEDGLMVQVPSETMIALRAALRDMHDYAIGCGPHAEETVLLQWTADDTNFNIGVKSCIDGRPLDGVPSIRVHSGTDYTGSSRLIRWTEVFILQSDEGTDNTGEPLDISRLSGSIAQATCLALVPLLDLLSAASLTTVAVRANIHPENVGYEAGGNGEKLPPFYMKSLDDELVAVVHQAALAAENAPATLELVFRIMEQG